MASLAWCAQTLASIGRLARRAGLGGGAKRRKERFCSGCVISPSVTFGASSLFRGSRWRQQRPPQRMRDAMEGVPYTVCANPCLHRMRVVARSAGRSDPTVALSLPQSPSVTAPVPGPPKSADFWGGRQREPMASPKTATIHAGRHGRRPQYGAR